MYLLHELLAALPPSEDGETVETELHMQDYNASVLSLVTFPNLLLTWYMSAAAAEFRNSQPCPSVEDADAAIPIPPADPHTPGDLPLPPALTAAFRASLAAHRITLRFFAGAWGAFAVPHPYALVLTSETIYRSASLAPLLRLLREAAGSGDQADQEHMCLVAAKVLYFGVGGGVEEFVRRVREMGGEVEPMWEVSAGVGRRVMRVRWHAAD
ncbi:hypothetical protein H0H81_004085 [Sphagnurus paluster]|uniref:Uncharacterized protein n=1 Tax=Sphagnurus paluster TaxID=117069 RepID=A0A9P7FPR1_9AGAR|nr:hypothetical protein H0H81_004085 [Sphagnurus paluster]